MDLLKGKAIMVWTFMGNARMYEALRDYGDRISQIGLFSFKVRSTGEIYESGVSIAAGSVMRTYISKWPHIKWLLTVANDGTNSIFKALRDNTNGAQDMFLSELIRIMEKYPWCDGIDIDLERGDDYSTHAASTAMFRNIYHTVKAYDSTKLMNICLPGMTSVNGSVGGENWCVYGDLNNYCDTASIMSYGMAWAGSAPGPVSPRSWLDGIYNYAVTVMNQDKVFLGMSAYGWNWQIYDDPANLGNTYRGTSNTYYAAKYWMTGKYNFTDDAPPQPFIPIVAYMIRFLMPSPMSMISWRARMRFSVNTLSFPELTTAGVEDREKPRFEKMVDGHTGFLFTDKDGMPLVAMHWEHRFNHMVKRYNDIYRVQIPNITSHVCRHTYCSNMAKSGMNPKTLQYLMGHSDIGVTLNTYTHLGLEDVADELKRMEELADARKELEKVKGENPVSQKMFRAI